MAGYSNGAIRARRQQHPGTELRVDKRHERYSRGVKKRRLRTHQHPADA